MSPSSSAQHAEGFSRRGRIENPAIVESSGLVRSRRWESLFWTHNDSGDTPRVFAIRGDGRCIRDGSSNQSGIQVSGAENTDWEDIGMDERGYLLIGDIGNNVSRRPTLVLYRVKEPNPFHDQNTERAERIPIYFPDSPALAFDSEALFWAGGRIYLLTKTPSGVNTGLYVVEVSRSEEKSPLMRVGSFDFEAPVTAADATPDGRLLAVLTYRGVWLFERPTRTDNYLGGEKSFHPIRIWQAEAICFDGGKLLIGNEKGNLFELDTTVLSPLK